MAHCVGSPACCGGNSGMGPVAAKSVARLTNRAARPVRRHAARLERRHLDAEVADFLRQHFGEAADGPFGGLIRAQARGTGAATSGKKQGHLLIAFQKASKPEAA
jgi:hypothetical protein